MLPLWALAALALPSEAPRPAPGGWTPSEAGDVMAWDRDHAARRLDAANAALQSRLDAHPGTIERRLIEAVRAHQIAWRDYARTECELIGSTSSGASPWQSNHAVGCETQLLDARSIQVRRVISCLDALKGDQWRAHVAGCLRGLAPMAVQAKVALDNDGV